MTGSAVCGRFVAELAPGVRPEAGSVAPEGGGQVVPALGGECRLGPTETVLAARSAGR